MMRLENKSEVVELIRRVEDFPFRSLLYSVLLPIFDAKRRMIAVLNETSFAATGPADR